MEAVGNGIFEGSRTHLTHLIDKHGLSALNCASAIGLDYLA